MQQQHGRLLQHLHLAAHPANAGRALDHANHPLPDRRDGEDDEDTEEPAEGDEDRRRRLGEPEDAGECGEHEDQSVDELLHCEGRDHGTQAGPEDVGDEDGAGQLAEREQGRGLSGDREQDRVPGSQPHPELAQEGLPVQALQYAVGEAEPHDHRDEAEGEPRHDCAQRPGIERQQEH